MIFEPQKHQGKSKENLCALCAFVVPDFPVMRMKSPKELRNNGR